MRKPILCLDFDGVMHSYTSGWQGAGVANDPPVPGLVGFLMEATMVFDVHVHSSRSRSLRGRRAMKRWCREHLNVSTTMSADHSGDWLYECLRFPWFKPAAFLTIDDRAVCFDGTWPDLETLRAFKPWNKRR